MKASTPIIALKAHAIKEERDRCLSEGFDQHGSKPINPRDLVEKVLVLRKYRGMERH